MLATITATMSETLKDFLDDLKHDICIELNDVGDEEKEVFFRQLADWAYSRQEYLISKL